MDRAKARAASLPNPLGFLQKNSNKDKSSGKALSAPSTFSQRPRDPNCTDSRLLLNQKSIYERQLPGGSYITAHIARLQKGYYDSPIVHGDRTENCRFISISFVFHPVNTTHRFVSARISLSVQDKEAIPEGGLPLPPQIDHPNNARPSFSKATTRRKPKFLRHAPHLLYGALSPETLDWTFNLAGSLGVSQGPANASINPSGGVKSSYKIYKMMKIQGSVRTLNSWHGHEYDVEDGSLVWTLEENELQKSGLPREFTFALLLTKGDASDVLFDIDIDPVVGSWYGTYPKWWVDRIWYRPMAKEDIDIDVERGQRFGPSTKTEGFNFASLMSTFDDFVTMPGTMYSRSDNPAAGTMIMNDGTGSAAQPARQLSASPAPQIPQDLNIRVFLEGSSRNSLFGPPTKRDPADAAKSTSPNPRSGLVISRSRNSSRGRPRSQHYPSPPPRLDSPPTTQRARPVSAIYEVSTAPIAEHEADRHDQRQRSKSEVTDISEDLFLTPLSPIKGLRGSKLLRHSRSRPDLQDEFDSYTAGPPSQSTQHRKERSPNRIVDLEEDQPLDLDSSHQQTVPIRRTQSQNQGQSQGQSQGQGQIQRQGQNHTEPKTLPRYPRRVGAQPMRRTSNTQQPGVTAPVPPPASKPNTTTTTPSFSSSSQPPSKPTISTDPATTLRTQNPNNNPSSSSSDQSSQQKRMTPRQARNSAYINPVDLNHARFKLAEDSPTLPPPPQPPSFPPTSFPNFATTTAATTASSSAASSDLPPSAPMPPSAPAPPPMIDSLHGLGVDTLVQQEVTNYLKAHPELYSPQSSLHNVDMTNGNEPGESNVDGGGTFDHHHQHHHRPQVIDTTIPITRTNDLNLPSSFTHQNFSMSNNNNNNNNARLSTATTGGSSTQNNNQHIYGYTSAGAGPSSNGNVVGGGGGVGVKGSGRHRRSQSMQQTSSLRDVNPMSGTRTGHGLDYEPAHSPVRPSHARRERSRSRDRNASEGNANGEFIRVSLGGVGHGGWEYLE